jgi:hypothetical protein
MLSPTCYHTLLDSFVITSCYYPILHIVPCYHPLVSSPALIPCYQPCYRIYASLSSYVIFQNVTPSYHTMLTSNVITPFYRPMLSPLSSYVIIQNYHFMFIIPPGNSFSFITPKKLGHSTHKSEPANKHFKVRY